MPGSPYAPTLLNRTLAKSLAAILASLCRSVSAEATVVRQPSRINPQGSQAVVGNGLQCARVRAFGAAIGGAVQAPMVPGDPHQPTPPRAGLGNWPDAGMRTIGLREREPRGCASLRRYADLQW